MTDRERLLDDLRQAVFAIAYRMLGSVSEAEDIVQEALLRLHRALDADKRIASPRAFVATVATRPAINQLIAVVALEIADGQITSISAILNPDKLTYLGPLADYTPLLRSAR